MSSQVLSQSVGQLLSKEREVDAIPIESLLRKDRSLRFERGGAVYATNGRVGRLVRVVVDESAGEVTEIIVDVETTGQKLVLPVGLITKTGGSATFLSLDRSEVAEYVDPARIYEKGRFKKANLRTLRKNGKRTPDRSRRQAVAEVGDRFLETLPLRELS